MMIDPPHIGSFIKTEIIEAHGLNVSAGARALGVTRQALSALLNCHRGLSPDMALRLEKAFGVRVDALLRMQTVYDIGQARKRAPIIDVPQFEAS